MADGDGNNNFSVYLGGGEQELPDGVTHAIIDPSVTTVRNRAFWNRQRLVSVIFHDGVKLIGAEAFYGCPSLRGAKLLGVREIRQRAFDGCFDLEDVEFGDRLETIGFNSFYYCSSLRRIKLPSVRFIGRSAFSRCYILTDVEFGCDLETIGFNSFYNCPQLRRISIPLKDNMFLLDPDPDEQRYNQFNRCGNLATVDIVGAEGVQKTISSLLLESWRDEMSELIDRINQQLPNTLSSEKTDLIRLWVRSVINRMDHYKAEHNRYLKEHMTLLELALWKAKLNEKEDDSTLKLQTKRAKIDEKSSREEKRITSGADIIIKNVFPFLRLA